MEQLLRNGQTVYRCCALDDNHGEISTFSATKGSNDEA